VAKAGTPGNDAPPRKREATKPSGRGSAPAVKADSLDLPTSRSIGYLVRETHRAFQRELEPRIERFGITAGMWWFLRALWNQDGVSQTELSANVQVMGPTTVRAVERMEQRGLIERRREGSDGRKMFIYLTEEGRQLREKLVPVMLEVQEKASARLSSKEVEDLRRLLTLVKEGLA